MVRWMCGVKLKDRHPSKQLRERLGVDNIALVLQQYRLRWYGHVLRKDDDDWAKKCMEYEVEGPRPRERVTTGQLPPSASTLLYGPVLARSSYGLDYADGAAKF